MKTVEEYFLDWETHLFGYGYGTGETPVLTALNDFLKAIPMNVRGSYQYDYKVLEKAVGASTAWLLLNILIRDNKIEYGTSPRYGWLSEDGIALSKFFKDHTLDKIIKTVCYNNNSTYCWPEQCQCDDGDCRPNNPFLHKRIV